MFMGYYLNLLLEKSRCLNQEKIIRCTLYRMLSIFYPINVRMRTHYAEYEPMLRQLHHKYEMAMKEKTLNRVERDRAIGQAEGLRSALVSFQKLGLNTDETAAEQARGKCSPVLSSVDPMSGVKSQARNSVNLMRKSFGVSLR